MSWIVAILLAPLALALVVISLPFHVSARGTVAGGELSGALGLRWAFGLVGVELGTGGAVLRLAGVRAGRYRIGRRRGARERRRKEGREEGKKPRKSPAARLRAGLGRGGRLLGMAARLAGALHLRLRLRGRVGADDPADTAALAGMLRAARAVPGVDVQVEVDWLDEVLELEARGRARVWVAELAVVAGLLFLERENRAAVRALAG